MGSCRWLEIAQHADIAVEGALSWDLRADLRFCAVSVAWPGGPVVVGWLRFGPSRMGQVDAAYPPFEIVLLCVVCR